MISNSRRKSGPLYSAHILSVTFILLISIQGFSRAQSIEEDPNVQFEAPECSGSSTPTGHCRLRRPENETQTSGVELSHSWAYETKYRTASEECLKSKALGLARVDESGCYNWRYRYIDEQHWKGHEVKVVDKSIDQRVANSLYTAISTHIVNMDFFTFASGDKKRDEQNMRALEGPQVDERRCGEQLSQVLQMIDEFAERLETKRKNASLELDVDPKHIYLARVLDSFGRYESGLFLGKTHLLGGFDQCVTSRLLLPSTDKTEQKHEQHQEEKLEKVKTRYCWARMDFSKHLSADLRDRIAGEFEAQEKKLMLATCLPETCHSSSFLDDGRPQTKLNRQLAQRLIDTQFQLPKSLFIDQSLALSTISCLPDAKSDYGPPLMGKLVIGFIVSWSLLACYATYYQETRPRAAPHKKSDDVLVEPTQISGNLLDGNSWVNALFDCLNLKKSWQDFVEEPYDEKKKASGVTEAPASRKVELDVLNPIKTFGAGFVVLGHAVISQVSSSMDYLRALNKIENDPGVLAMILGTVIVDTFFVITGVLMGYVALRKSVKVNNDKPNGQHQNGNQQRTQDGPSAKSSKKTSQIGMFFKHWAKFVIQRHLRLIPLFFLVYWFKRSYLIYSLGSGMPLWDLGSNKDTVYGSCREESWLVPFTTMTAFLPLNKQCLSQSWSVSADLFFSIVLTPIILILTKKPKLGLSLAALMMLMSHLLTLHAYNSVPSYMAIELAQVRAHGFVYMFGYLSHLYTYPHFRLTSVLVGLAVGYLLHQYHESEKPQWPQWLRGWATKGAFLGIVGLFASIALVPDSRGLFPAYELTIFIHLFTTGRIVWAICNGILIIRMSTDWKDSFLMRQFATPYWSKLVKLNFAILLIHLDALLYQMGSATVLGHFTKLNIFVAYGATYLVCIPIAMILHVLFENPVDKLIRRHVLPHILP